MGPELFKQRIKDTAITALCTASDEAFTLLLLENSYARGVDIYQASGGIPSQRRGDLKCQFASDIEAKYTRGGIKLSPDKDSQVRKGWTTFPLHSYVERRMYNSTRLFSTIST